MSGADMKAPSKAALENLFINNNDFEAIAAHLNRFNPIKVMRMEQMEIRHSAILAWLLDPMENHGLGDAFLRSFLAEALKGEGSQGLDAIEVYQTDMSQAIVRREWKNIDIFISLSLQDRGLGEPTTWAFVIENKINSVQRDGQLKDYLSVAEYALGRNSDRLIVQGVFLTLYEEEPDEAVAAQYVSIGYDHVYDVLSSLLETKRSQLGAPVQQFLEHYLEVIGAMTDKHDEQAKLQETAKRLYREHKKVLDFIMEHGAASDFTIAVEEVFGSDLEYSDPVVIDGQRFRFDGLAPSYVSFLPESWFDALGQTERKFRGCEDGWAEFPVILWLEIWQHSDGKSGQIGLYGEVGPLTEYEFRRDLIHAIQEVCQKLSGDKVKFRSNAASKGAQSSKFFRKNFLDVRDVQDAEEIAAGIRRLLMRFKPEIEAIGSVLPQFAEYGYVDG